MLNLFCRGAECFSQGSGDRLKIACLIQHADQVLADHQVGGA